MGLLPVGCPLPATVNAADHREQVLESSAEPHMAKVDQKLPQRSAQGCSAPPGSQQGGKGKSVNTHPSSEMELKPSAGMQRNKIISNTVRGGYMNILE